MRMKYNQPVKHFTKAQINMIRRTAKDKATIALSKRRQRVGAVRVHLAIEVLCLTGLRASEVTNLRVGDFATGYGESELYIRNGKGGKSRTIEIPAILKAHVNRFIKWKASRGEGIGEDDHLFIGQRGPWRVSALQQAVRKHLTGLGLYRRGKATHAIRHSYAYCLYNRDKDLRAVQQQLGHSSITTTTIYAHTSKDSLQAQVNGMWA